MLLLKASGKSTEDIHAYQLFEEGHGPMSFEDMAARFKECGWKRITSRNTVEPLIDELVVSAELEVQNLRQKYETLCSVRRKYPGGLNFIVDRVRRHIKYMIMRTDLKDLFDDPNGAADTMGQFFFRLMEDKIPGDWERNLDEEFVAAAGFESFIEYVCGGLTYEQFSGIPQNIWLDLERLGCFIFFLKRLESKKANQYDAARRDLAALIRLVQSRSDVTSETRTHLDACLAELGEPEPDLNLIKNNADSARLQLQEIWDHWYLKEVAWAQSFSRLIAELDDPWSAIRSADVLPSNKIDNLLEILRRGDSVAKVAGASMQVDEIRKLLNEIMVTLGDSQLLESTQGQARHFKGTIAGEMKKMHDGIKKGLAPKRPLKKHLEASLSKLLGEIRPYDGDRKCRPYEILLFAAQNNLLKDKFVRARNKLNAGFIPNPPVFSSLSILETHKGGPF